MDKHIKLKRVIHPLSFTGFERTYREIVKVEDGICHTKFHVTAEYLIKHKGYEAVVEEGEDLKKDLPNPPPGQVAGSSLPAKDAEKKEVEKPAAKKEVEKKKAPRSRKRTR